MFILSCYLYISMNAPRRASLKPQTEQLYMHTCKCTISQASKWQWARGTSKPSQGSPGQPGVVIASSSCAIFANFYLSFNSIFFAFSLAFWFLFIFYIFHLYNVYIYMNTFALYFILYILVLCFFFFSIVFVTCFICRDILASSVLEYE